MSGEDKVQLNWIERRALKETTLSNHASDVWQEARSAIQDCCKSFRNHYGESVAALEDKLENGFRIRVTIIFQTLEPHFKVTQDTKRIILVAFNESIPSIEVTRGDSPSKEFRIDADGTEAFITDGGLRIGPDEFSKRVLERALFIKPRPQTHPSSSPSSERSWMA